MVEIRPYRVKFFWVNFRVIAFGLCEIGARERRLRTDENACFRHVCGYLFVGNECLGAGTQAGILCGDFRAGVVSPHELFFGHALAGIYRSSVGLLIN